MQFITSPKNALGLDISDLSIKIVEIKKKRGKKYIHSMAATSLPRGLIEGGLIRDPRKIALVIKKLMRKAANKFTTKYAVVSLPETKTFIKVIEVPAKDQNKTTMDLIKKELPRHVPMNLEDMQIDWQKIKEGQGMKKILVGAVDKQIVQDYINLCCLAGLEVVALEIEAQAIARSIILNGRRQKKMDRGWNKIFKRDLKEEKVGYNKTTKNPKMILDLGATRTSVILFDEGVVQFTNSLGNISGEQITNTIIDRKRLSYLEAEKAKLICGTNSKKCKGIVRDVMKETIDNIAREIINGDEFYKTHFGKESANLEVWLCGGGANMLGLTEALEDKLHRKVKVADPLINIEETLAEQHKNLSAYTTAIGLALRNF